MLARIPASATLPRNAASVSPRSAQAHRQASRLRWLSDGASRPDARSDEFMPSIKISSKVDDSAWNALKAIARESRQSVSGLPSEAVRDYVRRRRVRPVVLSHLHDSIRNNEALGRLLGRLRPFSFSPPTKSSRATGF